MTEDTGRGTPPEPRGRKRHGWRLADPTDSLLAVVLLTGCAGLFYVTTTFEEVSELLTQNIRPETFPRLLLYIIAALALLLPFEKLFGTPGWRRIRAARSGAVHAKTWATLGLLAVVAASARSLGMVVTIFGICVAMPILWGARRPLAILVFAVIFTTAVTVLFNSVLKVHFEPGLFGIAPSGLG